MTVRGVMSSCYNAYTCLRRDDAMSSRICCTDERSFSDFDICTSTFPPLLSGYSRSTGVEPADNGDSQLAAEPVPAMTSSSSSSSSYKTSRLFAIVDRLFDGDDSDKQRASALLEANRSEV